MTCIHLAQNKVSSSLLRTMFNPKVNHPHRVPDTEIKTNLKVCQTQCIFFIGPNSTVCASKEYVLCLTGYMSVFGIRLFTER